MQFLGNRQTDSQKKLKHTYIEFQSSRCLKRTPKVWTLVKFCDHMIIAIVKPICTVGSVKRCNMRQKTKPTIFEKDILADTLFQTKIIFFGGKIFFTSINTKFFFQNFKNFFAHKKFVKFVFLLIFQKQIWYLGSYVHQRLSVFYLPFCSFFLFFSRMVVVQVDKNTFYSILFYASLNLFAFIYRITTFLLLSSWIKGFFLCGDSFYFIDKTNKKKQGLLLFFFYWLYKTKF